MILTTSLQQVISLNFSFLSNHMYHMEIYCLILQVAHILLQHNSAIVLLYVLILSVFRVLKFINFINIIYSL